MHPKGKGSAMSNPQEVIKTKMTEQGLQELTNAGHKGYSYLRHCVGVLKKYDKEEGFAEYCDIKDNKDEIGNENKTSESRKAAYTFASKKAATIATESLVKHARDFIQVVSADDHDNVEKTTSQQGPKPGNLLALKIAGDLASSGYNRAFRDDQMPHYSPAHELNYPSSDASSASEDYDEEDEEVFGCAECGAEYCDEEVAEGCCEE